MYINLSSLNSVDGKTIRFQCQSINQLIGDLKDSLIELFKVDCDQRIRLFFHGKELRDVLTILDYGIKINDTVHVCVQKAMIITDHESTSSDNQQSQPDCATDRLSSSESRKSINADDYYQIGDHIDCLHPEIGAWFEGQIVGLFREKNSSETLYEVAFWKSSLSDHVEVKLDRIRPQSIQCIKLRDLKPGDLVLANSNLTDPGQLGYWYDYLVTCVNHKKRTVRGTLFIGDQVFLEKHSITGNELFYQILKNQRKNERSDLISKAISFGSNDKRLTAVDCSQCGDNPGIPCRECSCCQCGLKSDPGRQIVCDECNKVFHLWCLPRPLERLPPEDEDWYCYRCKNNDAVTIEAKEEAARLAKGLKRKRKSQRLLSTDDLGLTDEPISTKNNLKLNNKLTNWGRGISCIGRSKICEIVPKDHFGPIPGVQVGTCWRFRFQASEAGVHTPLVAGIHGKESVGAFSIVFCCGYDDDVDLGDEIYFTGSGGRNSSESKCRVGGPQIKDQELRRCNKALAMNCAAPFDLGGADSGTDWKLGKPVRVLRSGNARGSAKKSPYLPRVGVRYDGIYKVVKYWPEKKATGFLVWRFLLRRDDEAPSPWSPKGKRRIYKLGLSLIEPPGYVDKKLSKKRSFLDSSDDMVSAKRVKNNSYKLSSSLNELIKLDTKNCNVWDELIKFTAEGEKVFLSRVEEAFRCACCLDTVYKPVTTFCAHNICQTCLDHSFKSSVTKCPICRSDLIRKNKSPETNVILSQILEKVFPNYYERYSMPRQN